MFTSASRSNAADPGNHLADLPASVRVDARLELGIERLGGETRLSHRHESGALRFRFPRSHGRPPEAVTVNIAGGLAGGDRVSTEITAGEGASISLTSAAAERIYRSAHDATRLSTRLVVKDDATALWLPQETILHNGSNVQRRFEIDLAKRARLVFAEMLYFGRRAAGEIFDRGALRESWRLRVGGALVLADETRMEAELGSPYTHPAALGLHVATASVIFACEDAGEALEPIRALLDDEREVESGATCLGALVLIRLLAPDAARLRALVMRLVEFLATRLGQPLPRALLT